MHCHNLKKKPSDLSSPHYTSCCVLHILFSLQHILLCHPHYTFCCVLPTTHPAVFSPLHILLCSPHSTSCCVLPTTHPVVSSPLRILLCSPHYTPSCEESVEDSPSVRRHSDQRHLRWCSNKRSNATRSDANQGLHGKVGRFSLSGGHRNKHFTCLMQWGMPVLYVPAHTTSKNKK